VAFLARAEQVELDAAQPLAEDVFGAHVGLHRDTVSHDPGTRGGGHLRHARVVGVQNRHAAVGVMVWQFLDQLLLGRLDRVDGPHALEVHRLHRRHHANARGQLGQQPNIARVVHAISSTISCERFSRSARSSADQFRVQVRS
jgi:hypothetical protein